MNSDSLSGLTVLITRPSNQQQVLQQAIEDAGGRVLSLPLMDIAPITEPAALQDLKDKVMQLDRYNALIFVSNNAVTFGGETINNYWPQFPAGIDVIAVGPSTAKAASSAFGCEVIQPSTGMTSEDILELPQLQDVADRKIGIVRGQGGRELLAETLRHRGATVDYLEAYSRKPMIYESAVFCQALKAAGVNILTVTSSESLDRLTALLIDKGLQEDGRADNREIMQQLSLLTPSQRVAQRAMEAGYTRVYNASGADPASFVAALGELGANQE